jgi:chromosome segregation ATPase
MLHLAQVQKKSYLGKAGLRLLASQKSENVWTVATEEEMLLSTEVHAYNENELVLVEISNTQQILSIGSARDWVLEIVQKYLVTGITPAFLQQETERAEQWRQSLTLQSQELDRRALELEARREQIQALEEDLKREKKQFESLAGELEARRQEIEAREEQLNNKNNEA